MSVERHYLGAVPVTSGPRYHWFGYYDKFPWDATGRYVLALEVDFMDRPPVPDDIATVGMIDLHDGSRFVPLAETRAFNWQQGTHLQWLATAPDRRIVYNTLAGDHYAAVIRDVFGGETRELPLPIYAVSRDGTRAVTLNFPRVHSTRPGYGYNHLPDLAGPDVPADDGIWVMDLETGEHRLIVTIEQVREMTPQGSMAGARHWFNHLQWSTDDSRFVFLHRWRHGKGPWQTRMCTAAPDGSDVFILNDHEMTSHFDWYSGEVILAWARRHGRGDHYHLFWDRSDRVEPVGVDVFPTDGHCSYSPDRKWILTDTYPDAEHCRTLVLYRPEDDRRVDVGRFYSVPVSSDEFRCDLHPRWSRDGRQVCFDSTHEGERQMYVMDVAEVVG